MTNKIYEEYIMTLADPTLVDREEAAFNAADNAALAEAYRENGVLYPTMISPELREKMREKATRRRIEAIGF